MGFGLGLLRVQVRGKFPGVLRKVLRFKFSGKCRVTGACGFGVYGSGVYWRCMGGFREGLGAQIIFRCSVSRASGWDLGFGGGA